MIFLCIQEYRKLKFLYRYQYRFMHTYVNLSEYLYIYSNVLLMNDCQTSSVLRTEATYIQEGP